ncbi:PucR family transcriptional regulator [Nocardia blacklockiae]|uniref:PucR family transcriptional regulator n=1 Tax=Nocardia blacklockiae TaxID=480036 RepID=UPI0018939A32|nr:helix-turn-helix domain-containing protein [Nocardia blacklockiae]MBF6176469.1 helix-turn-helix domain-containing protein [Nocardia blacklockiae]
MPQQDRISPMMSQHVETFARTVCERARFTGGSVWRSSELARDCVELAIALAAGRECPALVLGVERAAEEYAREGISVEAILGALHYGVRIGVVLLTEGTGPGDELAAAVAAVRGYLGAADTTGLAVRLLHSTTTAITRAYVRQLHASTPPPMLRTLGSALLAGDATATMARRYGVEIADAYRVVAVAFSHPDGPDPHGRFLCSVYEELACRYRDAALPVLSADGGTILLPATHSDDAELDTLTDGLASAAGTSVTGVVLDAELAEIPATDVRAHELLDLTQRLGLPPRLYRFADLALEYQLTRPGPGMERLSALLDPLDAHPELLDTLHRHIDNNLNRQRTAHALRLHTNTVDYRLKRIARLTGLDITRAVDLWYVRSALVARGESARQP